MARFRVGDVCVIVAADFRPEFVGLECVILSIDAFREPWPYYVHIHGQIGPDGTDKWHARQRQLRLKRPPSWNQWLFDTSGVKDEEQTLALRELSHLYGDQWSKKELEQAERDRRKAKELGR